ncbi:MAG: DUF5786 family protein [Candidatus Aenigmatarchaeota archaeon]
MGFGAYDEEELERREKIRENINNGATIDASSEKGRYNGKVEYEDGTTEELLERFKEIK